MKLAIIGNSGSGKTTLASAISKKTKIPMYSLDEISFSSITNHKKVKEKPKAERERIIKNILKKDKWIIEGIYYGPWTHGCFASADLTLFVACNRYKRALRIVSRYIKRVVGLYDGEQETLKHLLWLLKHNHNMDSVYQDSIREVESISKKFKIIKGFKDAQKLLKSVYDIS